MSISALTEQKLARGDGGGTPAGFTNPSAKREKTFSDALAVVVAYIPTELITVYTFVIATIGSDLVPMPVWTFWMFFAATPLLVWLVYAVRCVEQGKPIPWTWSELPVWEAIAATIAFTVWSATLPRSALAVYTWYDQDVAAAALVVVSILLPLVGVLATKK
jgi:hypothetical protein